MLNDKQWPENSSSIGVDENIPICCVVPNTDLGPESARASTSLNPLNEFDWPLVQAKDISIDMDS